MPEFQPGELKTAIAPITVKPAGLDSEAELFLGPDELTKVATSGLVPFVSTGASQAVRLPVTMPDVEGTYLVYINVHVQDILVGAFQAIEDVIIEAPPALPFTMSITKIDTTINKYATAYWLMEVTCQISNPHGYPITHKLYCAWAFGSKDPNDPASFRYSRMMGRDTWPDAFLSVTLNPGQSVTLVSPFYYIDGWHDTHHTYEWTNSPSGMYSAGVRKKYYFRIIDELGNWSSYRSVGTR